MLNYANLNDVEFEALCQDIMERKLSINLRRFAPGKDGGVDLTNNVSTKEIIVQIKHYTKSDVNALVRSLKNELPKLSKLHPQKYYICCSKELSCAKINELFQHFQAYMASDLHIITLIEIDSFLKSPDNRDILKKHFKLWIDDTGILEEISNDSIFVDCEAFLDDVTDLHKLFVRTSAFDQALSVLNQHQALCIIGDPGVGKSITSKMLLLHYAASGYRVRYTTNVTDLNSLKSSLSRDPEVKEVILLDDCFGQAYFEMKSGQSTELVSLIKYVKHHPSKMLILNSRVTIFREARERHRDLVRSLDRNDFNVFVLDMSNLSAEEKAKILYNHLAFSGIPHDYFSNIQTHCRYKDIINHRNYNPRIIEFVCTPSHYSAVPANRYYEFIRKHLDNPQEMWADEYDDRLKPEDRILLQTIYSLTTNIVSLSLVQKCFVQRISTISGIDKTINHFNRSIQRLTEGFVHLLDFRGSQYISMRNPSVNDFLDGRLKSNPVEKNDLLQSICTPQQLRLIPAANRLSYARHALQSGKIDNFIFDNPEDPDYRSRFIGCCILSGNLCIDRYRTEFLEYITLRSGPSAFYDIALPIERSPLSTLLSPPIWNFYGLQSFFEKDEHLYSLLSAMELGDGAKFICACDPLFHGKNRIFYATQVEHYLTEAISEFCEVDATDYESALDVEQAVRDATYPDGPCGDDIEVDEDEAAETLEEELKEIVLDDLQTIFRNLPAHFAFLIEDIDEDSVSVSGTDSLIDDFLSNPPGHHEIQHDQEDSSDDGYSAIDAIFQR